MRLLGCLLHISRGSLTNGVHRTCELLVPVYDAQLRSVLASKVLAMDETHVQKDRPPNPWARRPDERNLNKPAGYFKRTILWSTTWSPAVIRAK
ncbi:MAG: transposase [Candidatus Krumholzibacteriia bacterium]